MKRPDKNFSLLIAAAGLTFGLTAVSFGQTPRATPRATPVPNEPEIISRADDMDDPLTLIPENERRPRELDRQPVQDDRNSRVLEDFAARIRSLESNREAAYDAKQRRLMMNLDILTRAEQRAESLRKQRFELLEKENDIRIKLDRIEYESRPEMIERSAMNMGGSLRPEELREARRRSLESEKANLETLLNEITARRNSLEQSVIKADELVERLRAKLERDIDDALADDRPADPDQ